jgi:hypothetical protein
MKTVFSNSMVAHVWAQQSQAHGHSGSMSFDGAVLFSYRTPIAAFVQSVTGDRVALVTSQTYSMTTSSKHMPQVSRALNYANYFRVPFVVAPFGRSQREVHDANFKVLCAAYNEHCDKARRARDYYGDLHANLQELADTANKYATAFGLEPFAYNAVTDSAAILGFRDARTARLNTPQAIAKRERDAAKREERKTFKAIAARAQRIADDQYRAEQRAINDAARAVRDAEAKAQWLNGSPHVRGAYFRDDQGGAYLRVQGDRVETSQGAYVPVADAIKAIRLIKIVRARGVEWIENGEQCPVGQFRVNKIFANGDIKAGCHYIQWAQIAMIDEALSIPNVV